MYILRTVSQAIALCSLASASPTLVSPAARGLPVGVDSSLSHAHHLAELDLGNYEMHANSSSLEKRLPDTYCLADPAQTGVCVAVGAVLSQVALGIAGLLKSDSDANDCSTHGGSVDGVTYEVYATGQNCDTTAQLTTIQGAVSNYIRAQGNNICGVHCIRLTHGGTYAGYITLGPTTENVNSFYCGSAYSFGQCGQGGDNDI